MSDALTQEQIAQLKSQADAAIKAAADKERAELEQKAQEKAKAEILAQQEKEAQEKRLKELEELVQKQKEAAEAKEKELLKKIDEMASSRATAPNKDPFKNDTTKVKTWNDLPEQTRMKIQDAYADEFFNPNYKRK